MKESVFSAIHNSLSPESLFLVGSGSSLTKEQVFSKVAGRQLRQKVPLAEKNVLVETRRGFAYWIDILTVWGLGGCVVPVDPTSAPEVLDQIQRLTQGLSLKAGEDDTATCDDLVLPSVCSTDLAAIAFTSGSTGAPKGVPLTHAALLTNAFATASVVKPTGRLYINIPFHFISALSHFLVSAISGIEFWGEEEKKFPSDLVEAIKQSKATAFGGSPLQWRWISDYLEDDDTSALADQLTWMMSSGDHLSREVLLSIRDRLPHVSPFVAYGLTELGGRFCILPPSAIDRKVDSVGVPIPGLTATVRDCESGCPLPTGETGDVYVESESLFSGYLTDRVALEGERSVDYGFKTGDLGRVDNEGYLFLEGRSDDVYKVAGLKVSSRRIVSCLMESGMFSDVAVAPANHPAVGNVSVVFYIVKEDHTFKEAAIKQDLRRQLPANHVPAKFIEVTEIPRTGSGKVAWKALGQMAEKIGFP